MFQVFLFFFCFVLSVPNGGGGGSGGGDAARCVKRDVALTTFSLESRDPGRLRHGEEPGEAWEEL